MSCRICLEEEGPFVHPCRCKGQTGNVHAECLRKWIDESKNNACEICKQEYHKKDVFAWNIDRVCHNLCNCKSNMRSNELFGKLGLVIFATSCFSLIFMDVDHLVVASCVSSLLISIIVLGYAIQTYGNDMGLYNAAFIWKLAFSIPYSISVLLFYIQIQDTCDLACASVHSFSSPTCSEKCPLFLMFQKKNEYLVTMWCYDLYMLVVVFFLRMVMIFYFHMRKLEFHDFETPEEEPLLIEA